MGTGLGVKRPGPRRTPAPCNLCGRLGGLRDALGLRALLALARFVGHLLTFVEGLEPRAVYGGVMHEEVLTLLVGRDEAVALILTEPLNRSLGHFWDPPFVFLGSRTNKKAAPHLPGGASIKNKTHLLLPTKLTTGKGRGS